MRQDGQEHQHQQHQPGASQDHPRHHSHGQHPRHSTLPAPVPHALSTRPSQPPSTSSTPHPSTDTHPAYFAYAPSSSTFFLDPPSAARPTVRRPRSQKACIRCHRRKARCTRNLMEDGTYRCDNCIRDNIECLWRESKRRGPKPKSTASASPTPQRSVAAISNLLNEGEDTRAGPLAPPLPPRVAAAAAAAESVAEAEGSSYEHARRPPHVMPPDRSGLLDEFHKSSRVSAGLRSAIDKYYAHLYAVCPVLHPATVLQQALDGTLDALLRDALLAGAAALDRRTAEARRLLDHIALALCTLGDAPSVAQMCAFQLAATVRRTLNATRYDAFGGAVARLVGQLGWHALDRAAVDGQEDEPAAAVDTWDGWVARETQRRVFWAVRHADAWGALVAGLAPAGGFARGVGTLMPCPDDLWDEVGALEAGSVAPGFRRAQPPAELLDRLALGLSQQQQPRQQRQQRQQMDAELRAWRDSLPSADRSAAAGPLPPPLPSAAASFFSHRLPAAHLTALAPRILLHLANRTNRTGTNRALPLLRRLLGDALAQSLLAHDAVDTVDTVNAADAANTVNAVDTVNAQSWVTCVGLARECAAVVSGLDAGAGPCWADYRAPFCLFVAAAVLLQCHGNREALREDLGVLWRALNEAGAAGLPADGFVAALRELGIDEAVRLPRG
ncbi:hypothetical protein LPJ53_001639 [Coemansia erecta]|uniref:Zn(2)-C6 fungal-type domain-containing protein n=1 Tax=Coemansia erecta TaxID=147472 RepID=A0A9W7Y5Z2_9FUNG|nr:hypothetical protein LPJ53_001639 [Coemansia erecta]